MVSLLVCYILPYENKNNLTVLTRTSSRFELLVTCPDMWFSPAKALPLPGQNPNRPHGKIVHRTTSVFPAALPTDSTD